MKMWRGKLERIDMLYTIPESWEAADSVFEWAKLLSNKSGKTMCPTIYAWTQKIRHFLVSFEPDSLSSGHRLKKNC